MGWVDVATFWGDSNDKDKLSSTSNDSVEDRVNNVDVNEWHTDGHAYTRTWSGVVSRGINRGSNVQL